MSETREPSRRSVLRAAAVGGSLVWAAPVVQAVAAPAHAAGTLPPNGGTGLSWVGVLLESGGVRYRIKFTPGQQPVIGDWEQGGCKGILWEGRRGVATAGSVLANVVQSSTFTTNGGLRLVLTSGVTMVDWMLHQGQCCITQTTAVAANYVVSGAGTSTRTWPAAPNKTPCRLA